MGEWRLYLAAASLLAEGLTVAMLRAWVSLATRAGLVGRDMNKPGRPGVAEAGGVWVVFSAVIGLLAFESFFVYTRGSLVYFSQLASLALTLSLAGLMGFVDDVLGWRRGLPVAYRIALVAPISAPLALLKHGVSRVDLPFVGVVDFGVYYPLVIVPVGVVGAANAFNMLAGYNGLEAGMGLLLMAFTSLYAASKGLEAVAAAALVMAAALAGFLAFNWYPAAVFPGNALTYAVGAYYAGLVVIGDFQKFGLSLFALYFLELALFLRGLLHGVYKQNFGVPQPDGSLKPPYERSYSLTHLAITVLRRLGVKATEARVVALILAAQTAIGAACLAYFT
ncbi:MraY family glycosyltransferase [Stetteria hydrogenophila]